MSYTPEQLKWAKELQQCEQSFEYASSKYFRIKSKHVIGFPTLKFNAVQQFIHAKAHDQLRRKGKIRLILGKGRQVGSSTYWRAFSFHRVAFQDYINALIVAHDEPSALELFQMDTGFYDALPKPLQPVRKFFSKIKQEFENRHSKTLVNHARNMNVGASQMNHIVHLTEVARFPDASQIASSLFPSISNAKGSAVVMESTSCVGGTWFKDVAEDAMKGHSEYEFYFIPWWLHEHYRAPVPKGFEPTIEEKELLREYPTMSWENLVWYRALKLEPNYVGRPALVLQEYPVSWKQSWVLPIGSLNTFPLEITAYADDYLRAGKRHHATGRGLEDNIGGHVEVYTLPKEGVFYDLGVDVSGGQTETSDWTAIEVVRRDTLEEVASVRVRIDPASEEFFDMVYWLGRTYNSAQIIADITGGWGHALMSDLQKRSYPNLWQSRRRDDAKERVSNRVGFYYTKRDKTYLIHNAVKMVQREKPIIRHRRLLTEMRGFLTVATDEWMPSPECKYDDCLNAYCLALLAAADERPAEFAPPPPERINPAILRPWAYHTDEELDGDAPNGLGSYLDNILRCQ